MQLATYLSLPMVRPEEFAGRVGISTASLSRISAGSQNTTRDVMRRIFEASGGAVTPNEIVGIEHGATPTAPAGVGETGNAGDLSAEQVAS